MAVPYLLRFGWGQRHKILRIRLTRNGITSADENRRFRRIERKGLFSGPNGI
jgi:hypothetical protein